MVKCDPLGLLTEPIVMKVRDPQLIEAHPCLKWTKVSKSDLNLYNNIIGVFSIDEVPQAYEIGFHNFAIINLAKVANF